MGAAILDFQKQGKAARLRVLSSMFEEDEMPVTHLFRSVPEMPDIAASMAESSSASRMLARSAASMAPTGSGAPV